MKRLLLPLLVALAVPAWAQHHRVWKGTFYQAPGLRHEYFSATARQLTVGLVDFPLETTARFEHDTLTLRDTNGQMAHATAARLEEARTFFYLESGAWKDHPDWRHGDGFQAPGGLNVTLRLDERGDLNRVTYPGHTVEYRDYAQVADLWTFRQRVVDGNDKWDLVSVDSAVVPSPLVAQKRVHFPAPTVEVPLSLWGAEIQLPGEMAGQSGLYIMDTGSQISTFDVGLAKRMGWPIAGSLPIPSAHWSGGMQWLRTPPLQLGPLQFDPLTVLGLDYGPSPLAENLNGLAGLIGDDVLCQTIVQIDYPAGKLRFFSQGYQPDARDREIPLRMDGLAPMVEVVANGRPHFVLLDTGSSETLYLPREPGLLNAASERFYDPGGVRFVVGTAGGWPARAELALGPFRWKQAPLVVVDPSNAKGLVVNGPGVLGYGILRHFRVTLDLAGGHLWLAQGVPFRTPPLGTHGLQIMLAHGQARIVSLIPRGPAQRAGLRLGDRILALNGLSELHGLGSDTLPVSPGEVWELRIQRGERQFSVRLKAIALP